MCGRYVWRKGVPTNGEHLRLGGDMERNKHHHIVEIFDH